MCPVDLIAWMRPEVFALRMKCVPMAPAAERSSVSVRAASAEPSVMSESVTGNEKPLKSCWKVPWPKFEPSSSCARCFVSCSAKGACMFLMRTWRSLNSALALSRGKGGRGPTVPRRRSNTEWVRAIPPVELDCVGPPQWPRARIRQTPTLP